jgi:hypothetical protein
MTSDAETKFEKMNEDDDQVIAFMDPSMTRGIDCYVDSYATVDGVEYTIGSPCDYAVALCYFEGEDEQLVPIELDDPLMDDIFPIAEGIIEEEFGEELVLLRTPQTLTLVGVSTFCVLSFVRCLFANVCRGTTLLCATTSHSLHDARDVHHNGTERYHRFSHSSYINDDIISNTPPNIIPR